MKRSALILQVITKEESKYVKGGIPTKDLIILGNGMAGMTAALYAKRANLDFKIVGRDEYDFGQIGNAIFVENFPCAESQSGFDLAMKLHDQLVANGIEIEEHEVIEVSKDDRIFTIKYADGSLDTAKAVIYALGASHRKLNINTADAPIHYCALCDGALYKDKTVAVIGGGDVAFTQAEYLSKICKHVSIVICDENVTASPSTFERVRNIQNVQILYNYLVNVIDHNYYSGRWILYNEYSDYDMLEADGIFVAIGMMPNTKPLENLILLPEGYIDCWEDTLQSTNCAGLYAVGDVRVKRVRQGLTAAADGAIAVDSVIRYLRLVDKL